MRKFIFILVLFVSILLFFLNRSSDKKLLKNFSDDLVNENIKIEKVINKYIVCDVKAIEITTIQLEYIRAEFKKFPSEINIYNYKQAKKKGKRSKRTCL